MLSLLKGYKGAIEVNGVSYGNLNEATRGTSRELKYKLNLFEELNERL